MKKRLIIILLAFCFFVPCMFLLNGCDLFGGKSSQWYSNADEHWRIKVVDGEEEYVDRAEHTWNGGSITKKATCTASGVKTYTCIVCGFKKTEEVEPIGHDFSERDGCCTHCGTNGAEVCEIKTGVDFEVGPTIVSYPNGTQTLQTVKHYYHFYAISNIQYVIEQDSNCIFSEREIYGPKNNYVINTSNDISYFYAGETGIYCLYVETNTNMINKGVMNIYSKGNLSADYYVHYSDGYHVKTTNERNYQGKIVIADKFGTGEDVDKVVAVENDAFPHIDNNSHNQENYVGELYIGNNIKTIGQRAFTQGKFQTLTIPDSVQTIGAGAFGNCDQLKTVKIGDGCITLGSAFYHCNNLTTVYIGKNVYGTGVNAFNSCANLTKVVIDSENVVGYLGTIAGYENNMLKNVNAIYINLEIENTASVEYLVNNYSLVSSSDLSGYAKWKRK